ncbi:MAG TPA: tetratricopeptide repeat protein, partial [Longimicrobiaceae bacterium]|nr:tetratricopeptide repeat protein [Longimicrobiaceae bacterium]
FRESDRWLRRAVRLAARGGDWEAQSRGLNSLGTTSLHRGDYREAARLLQAALRTARRRGLRTSEAECLHDLFAVHYEMGDWAAAEEHARAAFDLYRRLGHPRLPMLAHDLAYLWVGRGHFARALRVLLALRALPAPPEDRLRVLSSAVRAAGAGGERALLEELWAETWPLVAQAASERRFASALVELGLGASSLGEWQRAAGALELALELARERGEADTAFRAEAALAAVRAGRSAETARSAPAGAGSPGEALAHSLVSALEAAAR